MFGHGLLTLSDSSKNKAVVPRLRDVTLKASVHISAATQLEYQHDLCTNSTYFNIRLKVDPRNSEISAFEQYFIVNGLRDEFMFEIDYDGAIVASASDSDAREALLVTHAEQVCNQKIAQEIAIAEALLAADGSSFVNCVAQQVDRLLDGKIDVSGNGGVALVEKSAQTYLEWFPIIESCSEALVASAGFDLQEFSSKIPFEFLDLDKVRSLGSILGEIYEGVSTCTPYTIQLRKYHVGAVRVCATAKISEEQIKNCIAHCALSFFENLTKSPVGLKLEDAAAELKAKYLGVAQQHYEILQSARAKQKLASARQATRYAELLVGKLGSNAERLQLALDQDMPFLAIYYDTLTNHIRLEIEAVMRRELAALYACKKVSNFGAVSFSGPDWDSYLRHANIGPTSSPGLLTLRVSKLVTEYFVQHAWLGKLNIKKPDVIMLAEYEQGGNGGGANPVDEHLLVKNYFTGDLIPRNSEMLVDMKHILLEFDDEEADITLVENVQ